MYTCVQCGCAFSAHEPTTPTPGGEQCWSCSYPEKAAQSRTEALALYQRVLEQVHPRWTLAVIAKLGLAVLKEEEERKRR